MDVAWSPPPPLAAGGGAALTPHSPLADPFGRPAGPRSIGRNLGAEFVADSLRRGEEADDGLQASLAALLSAARVESGSPHATPERPDRPGPTRPPRPPLPTPEATAAALRAQAVNAARRLQVQADVSSLPVPFIYS